MDIPAFQKSLLAWYDAHRRGLPWRENATPYQVWISEVMLQQTQVATVLSYYQRFLSAFPDIRKLAAAPVQDVLKQWEGLGYYSRARNLHAAAQAVVRQHGGQIPDTYDAFRSLKGVGPYISAAVMSIAFGQGYAVVDGNVKRVLARLMGIEIPVNDSQSLKVFQSAADPLLDNARPGDYNQALMELGALICRPQKPECTRCPVAACCTAFIDQRQSDLPRRRPKTPLPEHRWGIVAVRYGDRYLMVKRPDNGLLGGLWEFPTGDWIPSETPTENGRRIVRDVAGIEIQTLEPVATVRHAFTHFRIVCETFRCETSAGIHLHTTAQPHKWVNRCEINALPLPKIHHKFLHHLDTL